MISERQGGGRIVVVDLDCQLTQQLQQLLLADPAVGIVAWLHDYGLLEPVGAGGWKRPQSNVASAPSLVPLLIS